jgi:LAO/AO transport system kinase
MGGVARKTRESILVCEAAQYDVVLVETVGVGQSETMVADMTDCFVALMLPGAGDELQAIKRGLLELVDVIVVNKADGAMQSAAELAVQRYKTVLSSLAGWNGKDAPCVWPCSALRRRGVDRVWDFIERRHERHKTSGQLAERRQRQNLRWLWVLVDDRLRQAIREHPAVRTMREDLEREVLSGARPAEVAARQILDAFGLSHIAPLRGRDAEV